ncbi:MAG: Unknown protein [uncultured Sulfurovum sp.]|uniref:Uncharacterized protein n=1 Tax=uncultured Sulfurovum sp. TaxID=269237 RepID=A0A6S6SPE9_9BACT|nr:MAG: Unknown protein [uncultured Sulfurovum sp.]
MQTINLNIDDSLLNQAIQHWKNFLSQHQKESVNFTYVDDIGDTIQVINGIEYVVPTKEDKKAFNTPKKNQDFTSLDSLKSELS